MNFDPGEIPHPRDWTMFGLIYCFFMWLWNVIGNVFIFAAFTWVITGSIHLPASQHGRLLLVCALYGAFELYPRDLTRERFNEEEDEQ